MCDPSLWRFLSMITFFQVPFRNHSTKLFDNMQLEGRFLLHLFIFPVVSKILASVVKMCFRDCLLWKILTPVSQKDLFLKFAPWNPLWGSLHSVVTKSPPDGRLFASLSSNDHNEFHYRHPHPHGRKYVISLNMTGLQWWLMPILNSDKLLFL